MFAIYKVLPRTYERIAIWSPRPTPLLAAARAGAGAASTAGCLGASLLGAGSMSTVSIESSTVILDTREVSSCTVQNIVRLLSNYRPEILC